MIITGIVMLFVALLEYVLVIIYTDYRMLTRLVELGSSTGTVVSNIPEPFWDTYKVQIILSVTLIWVLQNDIARKTKEKTKFIIRLSKTPAIRAS